MKVGCLSRPANHWVGGLLLLLCNCSGMVHNKPQSEKSVSCIKIPFAGSNAGMCVVAAYLYKAPSHLICDFLEPNSPWSKCRSWHACSETDPWTEKGLFPKGLVKSGIVSSTGCVNLQTKPKNSRSSTVKYTLVTDPS